MIDRVNRNVNLEQRRESAQEQKTRYQDDQKSSTIVVPCGVNTREGLMSLYRISS